MQDPIRNNAPDSQASRISNGASCIFCKIVRGEIPADMVYEDDKFVAFLALKPMAPGHTLVVPKEHYRWVWDVPYAAEYAHAVNNVAHAIQKAFSIEAVHGKIEGEEVFHAHFWVYPSPKKAKGEKEDYKANAAKIRAALI